MAVGDDREGPAGHPSQPEFDRQPPQDIAAEQAVLGGMLLSKDAIADVVEVLRPTDFYRPAHQLVYDAILDLYGRGEPADALTVTNELTRSGQLARAETLVPSLEGEWRAVRGEIESAMTEMVI